MNKYLQCPEQYRLHYLEGLRPRFPSVNLVFGKEIHVALAGLFQNGVDPTALFRENWIKFERAPLTYNSRQSWEGLQETGTRLLDEFQSSALSRFGNTESVESAFTLTISGLSRPFVGVIDFIGEVDGRRTVLDFKTAASAYPPFEVALNDQLTAYQLVEPECEQAVLCVLMKTKEPRIDWHLSSRGPEQLSTYLAKVAVLASAIEAGQFYRRPGRWCGWCDFLPVCLGDKEKAHETLVRVAPDS